MSESLNISSETFKPEYEKIVREFRTTRKDLSTIAKENKKLQAELKIKNETINSLINQNFTELKSLQEKHEKIVNSLSTSYEGNIKNMDHRYKQFRQSLHTRLKDSITTHYKMSNDKINLLTTQNNLFLEKIKIFQQENLQRETKMTELNSKHESLTVLHEDLHTKYKFLEEAKNIFQQQIKEMTALYENQINIKIEHDKMISNLSLTNEKLELELNSAKYELGRNEDHIKKITFDIEHAKNSYHDIHHKHVLLLNDNLSKQNSIDEKTLEILALNSKLSEIEKKNIILESARKDINIKVTELIHQIDNLQSELMSAQKIIHQLKVEKDVILDEKLHYIKEADSYKQKMMEVENIMLEKMRYIQDSTTKEKEKCISDYESKIKEMKDKNDKQMVTMRHEYNSLINEREKHIDGLTSHIKSYTDNQYITLGELEKIKLQNEKFRLEQSGIDQKINELNTIYKKDMEDLKNVHKKEKDMLVESYNENIKKAHELNDALQNRLGQSIEALSLSKTALSNLKETNENLKQQIQIKDNDDNSFQEKYDQIKSENLLLREKLDRSIELNNSFGHKEKQYETQIKQLQNKYGQLIALTKKGMNNNGQL
jgi:chromosome segregation ATPase